MQIQPFAATAIDKSTIMLERLLKLSAEQTVAMAEKLIKTNVQMTISEQQSETMGKLINILV